MSDLKTRCNRRGSYAGIKDAQCMDIIDKFKDGVHTMIGAKGIPYPVVTQRFSIARAFSKNAPVLILDEATAFA